RVLRPSLRLGNDAPRLRHGTSSMRRTSSMRCPTHSVVPGPAEGRSPEPITVMLSDQITARAYGFRARRCAAPRNDAPRLRRAASSMKKNVIYDARHLCCAPSPMRRRLLRRRADGHGELADALDLALELVACDRGGDAGRSAGHDDVAGGELDLLGEFF